MLGNISTLTVVGVSATVALAAAATTALTPTPVSSPAGRAASAAPTSDAWPGLARYLSTSTDASNDSPSTQASRFQADKSYYVTMRDGTRLALSLYFPNGGPPSEPAPTIFVQSRYGRATMPLALPDYERFWNAGYVVAIVDVRGTTASFGTREVETSQAELDDTDELVAHLTSQPWSNGQVIAHGVSYMGNTADFATGSRSAGLIGSIPRQVDFDLYRHVAMPGGIMNEFLLQVWSGETQAMDEGRYPKPQFDCRQRVQDCAEQWPFLTPVDGADGYELLHQAVQARNRWTYGDYKNIEFSDDKSGKGFTLFESSPASKIAQIRQLAKPVQYWGSWVDAGTADAALSRYRSAPNVPTEVWITANSHLGKDGADPFFAGKAPVPSAQEQFDITRGFADRLRRGETIERRINYYVMGAGTFRQTTVWPPADAKTRAFVLGPDNTLVNGNRGPGVDRYDVDFTANTGRANRWTTNYGAVPAYGDRRNEDRKLFVYDSEPMREATEIVGTPVVTLHMASQTADPTVFVYLEDVAPDGRVTYLTEGQLRAIHRKEAEPNAVAYDQGPVSRSFKRADATPVVPGDIMELRFSLFPTAALIKPGHRIRVAIAGADATIFRRYSENKAEAFTIHRGGKYRSMIELTTRPFRKD